jgi:hypothetical protein
MWLWVLTIFSQNLRDEVETNFVFFTCVWLVPMLLGADREKKLRTPRVWASANTLSTYEPSFLSFLKQYLEPASDRDPVCSGVRR